MRDNGEKDHIERNTEREQRGERKVGNIERSERGRREERELNSQPHIQHQS
jgi:hypothetical protein